MSAVLCAYVCSQNDAELVEERGREREREKEKEKEKEKVNSYGSCCLDIVSVVSSHVPSGIYTIYSIFSLMFICSTMYVVCVWEQECNLGESHQVWVMLSGCSSDTKFESTMITLRYVVSLWKLRLYQLSLLVHGIYITCFWRHSILRLIHVEYHLSLWQLQSKCHCVFITHCFFRV